MVDPVSLAALGSGIGSLFASAGSAIGTGISALGTAGGLTAAGSLAAGGAAVAGALGNKPRTPTIPAQAPPVQNPIGSQTTNASQSQGPSFLAAAAAPNVNQLSGSKSLLGQ